MKWETFFLPLNVQWSEKRRLTILLADAAFFLFVSHFRLAFRSRAPHNCVTKSILCFHFPTQYSCFSIFTSLRLSSVFHRTLCFVCSYHWFSCRLEFSLFFLFRETKKMKKQKKKRFTVKHDEWCWYEEHCTRDDEVFRNFFHDWQRESKSLSWYD